jgi:hypothetical protein
VAARLRVERRDPHQAVHALLGGVEAVRVLAVDDERRGLDASLLPRADLGEIDLEAAPLGPAHLHPQQHLGPVLRVRAARARVDGDDRVARVVAAGEQALLLELVQARLDRLALLLELGGDRVVLGRHLLERLEVLDVGLERAEDVQPPRRGSVLRRDLGRRVLVVPEAGRLHRLLELGDLRLESSWVKGSPRAASAGRGGHWR